MKTLQIICFLRQRVILAATCSAVNSVTLSIIFRRCTIAVGRTATALPIGSPNCYLLEDYSTKAVVIEKVFRPMISYSPGYFPVLSIIS